jgi:hypothetical protein
MVICSQIPTTFSTGGRTLSLLLNVHRISDVRQIGIYTAKLLVTHPSPSEDKIATAKFNRYK